MSNNQTNIVQKPSTSYSDRGQKSPTPSTPKPSTQPPSRKKN